MVCGMWVCGVALIEGRIITYRTKKFRAHSPAQAEAFAPLSAFKAAMSMGLSSVTLYSYMPMRSSMLLLGRISLLGSMA